MSFFDKFRSKPSASKAVTRTETSTDLVEKPDGALEQRHEKRAVQRPVDAPLAPTANPKKPAVMNRWERKRTEEATALTRARTEFVGEWMNYQETNQRAQNIDKRLEAVDLEEDIRLQEAQARNAQLRRELSHKALQDELAAAELEAQILEARARQKAAAEHLEPKPEPDPRDELDRYRENLERQQEKRAIKDEFARQNKVQDADSKFELLKAYDEQAKKKIAEVLAGTIVDGRSPDDLTPEEEHEIANIRDYYQNLKDGL